MVDKQQRTKKIWLRIASVIMSLLLWFYVINQGDVASGSKMTEVALQYYNVPADLNVSGPEKVSIKVWGSSQGSGDIVAYVDLNGYGKGVYEVPVKLDRVQGAMLTSVQPNKVEVRLEELSERVIQIKHEVKQNTQTGYQLSQALLSPDRCLIKGDAEAIAKVAAVVAPIDLGNVIDIAMLKPNLQARDANGNTITEGIQIVPTSINVYVVVEKKQLSKKVNVMPQFNGTIAEGFTMGEVKTDPAQVTILGDQIQVEGLNEVITRPINIDGKEEGFTQTVELIQPEGVSIVPGRVTVQVVITKKEVVNVRP